MWIPLFYMFFRFHVLFAKPIIFEEDASPTSNLYVFGDSSFASDRRTSGHDSWMKSSYFPYGSSCNYIGVNRFSDGITLPDFIARDLGLNELPQTDEIWAPAESEVNFASASAGILLETGTAFGKNVCFKEQIGIFKELVQNKLTKRYKTGEKLSNYLSESVYLINIGASDYIFNYLQPNYYNTSNHYSAEEFAELLTSKYSNYIKDLYKLGARKMVIFEISPLGCLPYVIEKLKPRSSCAENINDLVSKFNNKLDAKLTELRKELKGSQLVTARMFSLMKDMIKTPKNYGFEETRWPCCPTDKNATGLCKNIKIRFVPPSELRKPSRSPEEQQYYNHLQSSCEDLPMPESLKRSKKWTGPNNNITCLYRRIYIFWDELHLTQAANRIIAERLVDIGGWSSPIRIRQLVLSD